MSDYDQKIFRKEVRERLNGIEETNAKILNELSKISAKLNEVEEDTAKNAEIASLFTKYKPTIDKVENGLNAMMSPRSWLGYGTVEQLENGEEEPEDSE